MNRNLCAGALLSITLSGVTLCGQEQKLNAANVPDAVKATASKEFPNARIARWSKETENGKVTYEASVAEGASKRDVSFASDGSLLAIEEAMKISDLPAAVTAAIHEKYPQAAVRKAEKISHGNGDQKGLQYEVDLKNASKKEVLFDADGKVVEEE